MLLKKITLNNIRSYKTQEIEFPEGSTLLAGDIGSGKTSILLAIEFALFGLQPGQRGSSLLRNGETDGGATIEFQVDDKEVIIERTLKRKKTISQDYSCITINGEKHEISVTEIKNKVLELLDYPTEFSKKQNILYRFTVFTPQEEMKQIILEDAKTRVNTLRHIFGIDKYKKILENSTEILIKIREEKRLKEGMISNLDSDKQIILEKQIGLEQKKSELALIDSELASKKQARELIQIEVEELTKKREEKQRLQQEVEKSKLMISTKNESISSNNRSIQQLKEQIQESASITFDETKIQELQKQIQEMSTRKQELADKNLAFSSQISSLEMKNQDAEATKAKITKIEICPTCLQDVDANYKANVVNNFDSNISQNVKQIQELTITKTQIQKQLLAIDQEISNNQNQIQELNIAKVKLQSIQEKKSRLEEIEKNNASLERDINLLNEQIETLQKSLFEFSKYDQIFLQKQTALQEALQNEKQTEIKLAELNKEITFFQIQIQEVQQRIEKTEATKSQLEYLSGLEDWLNKNFLPIISRIEKNVMAKLKTEFSNLFSEWFSMLVSDSFNIRLDDDFTPIIEQQDYELDYAYLSGGERTAVALAYRLALNQVINSMLSKIKTRDLVILDEPTDGFSEQQLDKMRDVLNELDVAQLIIVSHEQKIENFVQNVIRLKKQTGESSISQNLAEGLIEGTTEENLLEAERPN